MPLPLCHLSCGAVPLGVALSLHKTALCAYAPCLACCVLCVCVHGANATIVAACQTLTECPRTDTTPPLSAAAIAAAANCVCSTWNGTVSANATHLTEGLVLCAALRLISLYFSVIPDQSQPNCTCQSQLTVCMLAVNKQCPNPCTVCVLSNFISTKALLLLSSP